MTITLPYDNQSFPMLRIVTRIKWEGDTSSAGGWTEQVMVRNGLSGMEVIDFERACLPEIGRASFVFKYGRMVTAAGTVLVAPSAATTVSLQAGGTWDPATSTLDVPDLRGYEVRIQAAPRVDDGVTPAWRTVWWGQVEEQVDTDWPGGSIPAGMRTYHCLDGFARTRRWVMNRHGVYDAGSAGVGGLSAINCPGHPGFNVNPEQPGLRSGNRSNSVNYNSEGGSAVTSHSWPSSAYSPWTDLQALQDQAWLATRPNSEPKFTISGATALYNSFGIWPVEDQMSVFDFTTTVCRRSRGLGLLYVDWADDTGSALGALAIKMTCVPQIMQDITYNLPAGGSGSISGSTTEGREVSVDLIGDHRLLPDSFQLSDQYQYWYDYLVTEGEPIEVMVTLDYLAGSLEKEWTDAAATAFRALAVDKRSDEKFRHIYQLHRLQRGATLNVGDGNGGGASRADYRCSDAGYIILPSGPTDTSPLMLRILDDIPLLEGYKYDSALSLPTRDDAASESSDPRRRDPKVYIRTGANLFKNPSDYVDSVEIKISHDGIMLYSPTDHGTGLRMWGDTTSNYGLGSRAKYSNLVLTCTIRLPHRVRLASGQTNADLRKRTLVIRHDGYHLWIAHAGAIWDLDGATTTTNGKTPKRGALTASKGLSDAVGGIIRDDRDAIAKRHALASCWYQIGQPLTNSRRTVQWSLRGCGFLGTFTQDDGTSVTYAKLGDTIGTMTAAGQTHRPKTPVTRVHYDAVTGVTSWFTNWTDLDFSKEQGAMG